MARSALQPLRVWDLPEAEHPAWVAAGFGCCSFARYRERVAKAIRRARDNRRSVVLLAVTVSQMLDELRALGLAPTPLGIDMTLRAIDA